MASINQISSPITVTDDLPDAWKKTITSLETQAGFKLDPSKAPTIAEITATINPPKAEPRTVDKAKKVVALTLTCIHRLGGMVSQVGSIVFGPSEQVMNAVSFVMQVCQATQEIFDNLTALMERLSVFLERLNQFFERKGLVKLESSLRRGVYRVLEHFVTIMALSYKLGRAWKDQESGWRNKVHQVKGRIQTILKVGAFGDDSDVKSSMAAFERAVADVSDVQIDQIYLTMSETARAVVDVSAMTQATYNNTQTMVSSLDQLRRGLDEEKMAKKVKKFLEIDDKDLEISSRAHKEFSRHLRGTGSWLFHRDEFIGWTSYRTTLESKRAILAIQGPEGFGKTHLSHAVIDKLQEISRQPQEQQLNMRVAWYYFSKEDKKVALDQALRQMSWQLALSDQSYMSYLDSISSTASKSNIRGLFKVLLADYSLRKPAAVFFLIFDGLDHAMEEGWIKMPEVLENLWILGQEPQGLRIRAMFTGPEETLDLIRKGSHKYMQTIDLAPDPVQPLSDLPQQSDIERYVADKLSTSTAFRIPGSEALEDMRQRILVELPRTAQGNYNIVHQHLSAVTEAQDLDQIRHALEGFGDGIKAYINRQITQLNEQLEGNRIKQVNEILAWVSVCQGELHPDTVRSMLTLSFGSKALFDPVEFVRSNCSRLLDVDYTGYMTLQTGVEDVLRLALQKRTVVTSEEISMIQAMLKTNFSRTFGDYDVYRRFEFEKFFDDKRNVESDLVHLVTRLVAHQKVLELCLKVHCDAQDLDGHIDLQVYAAKIWLRHLQHVTPGTVDRTTKQHIGRWIYRMLREDRLIDLWTEGLFYDLIDRINQNDDICGVLLDWLTDPDVIRTQADVFAENTTQHVRQRVFHYVVKRHLERWYDGENEEWLLFWLREYFQKAGPLEQYREGRWYSRFEGAELQAWEVWARSQIDIPINEAQWLCRTAVVLKTDWPNRPDDFLDIALKRCQDALKLDPDMWQARLMTATLLFEMQRYQECLDITQITHQANSALLDNDSRYTKTYWQTVVPTIADCYLELGAFDDAISSYQSLIDRQIADRMVTYEFYPQYCCMLFALRHKKDHEQALRLLDNTAALDYMLIDFRPVLHNHLLTLAVQASAFDRIDHLYSRALDMFQDEHGQASQFHLATYRRYRLQWVCGPIELGKQVLQNLQPVIEKCDKLDASSIKQFYLDTLVAVATNTHPLTGTVKRELSPDPAVVQDCLDYAQWLAKHAVSRDDSVAVDLTIARLHHLAGNEIEAKNTLRQYVRVGMPDGDRDNYNPTYSEVSSAVYSFLIMDDDRTVYAIWSKLQPPLIEEDEQEQEPEPEQVMAVGDSIPVLSMPVNRASNNSAATMENGTTVPKEQNQTAQHTTLTSTTKTLDGVEDEEGTKSPHLMDKAPEGTRHDQHSLIARKSFTPGDTVPQFDLRATRPIKCSGCRLSPTYDEEFWICRDCLARLCCDCYPKINKDDWTDIAITTCNKLHEHVRLPPFDLERWKEAWPDKVYFGADLMPTEKFFANIEDDWGLDGWRKAAAGIQRFKILWLQKRRRKQAEADAEASGEKLNALQGMAQPVLA